MSIPTKAFLGIEVKHHLCHGIQGLKRQADTGTPAFDNYKLFPDIN